MPADDEIGATPTNPDSMGCWAASIKGIFDRGLTATIALVAKLGVPRGASALREAERTVAAFVARLGDEITATLIGRAHREEDVRAGAAEAAREAASAGDLQLRVHGNRLVTVRLLGGSRVTVCTPYLAPDRPGKHAARGKSGSGAYPVLDHLGFVERTSPALAAAIARQSAALASFREAEDDFATRGVDLDVKTIRRLSEHAGERALRVRDALVAAFEAGERWSEGEFAGRRVAAVFDGGRTRTRLSGKRGRRRKKSRRRGFATPWREPKIMAIYEFDDKGKKTSRDPIYEGTFESWDDAFRIFAAECARRGVGEVRELVIAGDGSNNIWDRIDAFVAKIGIDPSRVTRVVDFYHAREHLTKLVSLCAKWSAKRRQCWISRVKRHLKEGRIEKVIEAGEALRIGRRTAAVEKELDYFRSRKDSMRYAALRARGLPIGTGVVESAIRRVVNLRLKGPGIFWEVDNAERMLILRARLKSGRWHELQDQVFAPGASAGPRRLLPRERTRAAA